MAHIRRDSGNNKGRVVARDGMPFAQAIIDEKAGENPYYTITLDSIVIDVNGSSRFTLYLGPEQRKAIVEAWQRADELKNYWRIPA